MKKTRKTVVYHEDVYKWLLTVQKENGFNFSQAVNFELREAKKMKEKKDEEVYYHRS